MSADPEPPPPHWTARDAEARRLLTLVAQAEKHPVSTRCAWCGWSTTGELTDNADAFAEHVARCPRAPTGVADRVRAKRTVTRGKRQAAAARDAKRVRKPTPEKPKPRLEGTGADRRTRAKQLYEEGRTAEEIAAAIGVAGVTAEGYLRAEGIKRPRGRPRRTATT